MAWVFIFLNIVAGLVVWSIFASKKSEQKRIVREQEEKVLEQSFQEFLNSERYKGLKAQEEQRFAFFNNQYQQKLQKLLGQEIKTVKIEKNNTNKNRPSLCVAKTDTRLVVYTESVPHMEKEQQTFRMQGNSCYKNYEMPRAVEGHVERIYSVNLSKIFYWTVEGSRQYTEKVSGGGGVNPQAALLGAIIGGTAGAVVGAAMGTQMSISSTTQVHDDRVVVLVMTDGRQQGFDYADYLEFFKRLLPDKEKEYMKMNGLLNEIPAAAAPAPEPAPAPATSSAADELAKFQNLLQSGAITQEEYDAKKKQLLGL